jgi:hypothetical protein
MRSPFLAGVLTVIGCGAPAPRSEPLSNKPNASTTAATAPDPGPPIDGPYVRGEIRVHPKAQSRAVVNGTVFVIVKRAIADGTPGGLPVAAAKLVWTDPLPFTLTNEHALVPNDEPWGDVIVMARYDHDSDAMTKEPGDIVGTTRAHAPADGIVVVLDEVLP